MSTDKIPPAFPTPPPFGATVTPGSNGMSLRDWFAGIAITNFTSRDMAYSEYRKKAARFCYRMADDMIAARSKSKKEEL